jgi:hypothetical protein
MPHAAAKMTATVPIDHAQATEAFRMNRYQVSTSFPFGFIKQRERREKDAVLVYLPLGEVDRKSLALSIGRRDGRRCEPPRRTGWFRREWREERTRAGSTGGDRRAPVLVARR